MFFHANYLLSKDTTQIHMPDTLLGGRKQKCQKKNTLERLVNNKYVEQDQTVENLSRWADRF